MKSAYFERNFSDYEIVTTKNLGNFAVVKYENFSDLVGGEVENLKFKDCEKRLSEFFTADKNNENFVFKDVKIFGVVTSLKVVINGFSARDSLKFDPDLIALCEPYKYAISNQNYEISMKLNETALRAEKFLQSIEYEFASGERKILVYTNEHLIFDRILKNS